MNRNFKGVWIPKEIWLSKELSLLEKCILVELDSLDNEDGCYASNKYLAEFCGCSEKSITRAIKHLSELNFIQIENCDNKYRKIILPRQNVYDTWTKCPPNNIYILNTSNTNNTSNLDTSILGTIEENSKLFNDKKDETGFLGSAKRKEKKPNLYSKCIGMINTFCEENNSADISKSLVDFLNMMLDIYKDKNVQFYSNIFKGKLNMLKALPKEDWAESIKQSLENGWQGFYEIKNTARDGIKHNQSYYEDEDYMKEQEAWREEMVKNGKRTKF